MINPSPSSLLRWCSAGQSAVFTPQWNEIISAGWASDWERREIIREWWVFWGRADLNTRGFRFVLCRFEAFVPTETHSSFITRVSIIIVFIKRLVKRRKTLWFCGGISRKRAAGWLRRSSAPRRPLVGWMPVIICLIWYEEEWSEPSWLMLIWTDGWKEGWMDGWMDPLLSSTISTSITSADPPRGDGGPLEYYYTSTASNQIMAACQTGSCRTDTDLTWGRNQNTAQCLDPNRKETPPSR